MAGSLTTYEMSRAERFETLLPNETFPPAYTSTTPAEEELSNAVELFRTQYHEYFPNRAPLLLRPLNECRSRKIICTFIKPTVFPFEELFDLESCARFFAGYMRYETLDDPEKLPDIVVSPATALQWQIANCFELSLLLTSALAGAGYNAYVVVGYARKFVCENDYSKRTWNDDEGLFDEAESDDGEENEPQMNGEYASLVRERPVLRGVNDPDPVYLQQQEQQEKKSQSDGDGNDDSEGIQSHMERHSQQQQQHHHQQEKKKKGHSTIGSLDNNSGGQQSDDRSDSNEKLIHSWVLVLPGGRKSQKEAVFVEPSTGELIAPDVADAFYTGVEAVFNGRNYFVNLSLNTPVNALSLDLNDGTQWEGVILDMDEEDEHDVALFAATNNIDRFNYSTSFSTRWRHHPADTLPPHSPGGALGGGSSGAGATSVGFAPAATVNVFAYTLRDKLPRPKCSSWVKDLMLSRAQYESRYPGGPKVIHYANATVHWYADYVMPDLRVVELHLPDTMYHDREQVHILFKHREDKLRRRSIYPTEGGLVDTAIEAESSFGFGAAVAGSSFRLLKEWFERGRMRDAAVEGLRLFTHELGVQRTMTFYWDARDDGLWRRQELFYEGCILRKVKEFYRKRDDHLWYRSATFERSNATVRVGRKRGSVVGDRPADEALRLDPIRMSEKYHRNEEQYPHPDEDVAKYAFVRRPGGGGEMWVYFHYPPNSIICPYRMYTKGARGEEYLAAAFGTDPAVSPSPSLMVCLPNAEPPSELEQHNERKRLAWWETVCLGRVRASMGECGAVLETVRAGREPRAGGVLSAFDTLRNRPQESEAERARRLAEAAEREASRKDYLAPYIAKLELPRDFDGDYRHVVLTAEQARQVRDEALRELKERLIQRGHIMQAQMDAEKEDFNRRQMEYQSNVDAAKLDAGREEEEFAQYCKEATWRMKTLDERLAKHIDQSSEKYAKLAQRLADDPRLAVLSKPPAQS
ncbi:uncharacterized protein TM35_000381940 [Trypanosoma theileri]|uniref:Coiled-coil domain-containing protein 135 n=1 Tax=Trypanosoma theileri TaxID=67003 RepID=A0A1X0NLT5_9TRYP|nr:uncharacterized protein TM35_000381940 [Trypanosoma theileri]ORC85119.1 hypothetical protein TM35_000381940 [Trypanosoma theileri]